MRPDTPGPSDWAGPARADASAAATQASVTVRQLVEIDQIRSVRALMEQVWGPSVVLPANVLRAMGMAGIGAWLAERDGAPVGFGLAFVGWAGGLHVHSHQVGVVQDRRSSGVGYAIKLAQRADALAHGITEMRWTYDPLLATNASFNLLRLGVQVTQFLPHCYGDRDDRFNAGDRTDRLKVTWRLDAPVVAGAPAAPDAGAPALVEQAGNGARRTDIAPVPGATIAVPPDYLALRRDDVSAADTWRSAMGRALTDVFAAGLGIAGYGPGGYVLGQDGGR